ncbi:MAG: glycogen synthase [Clostridiales bacterium]|jgi:starch synthase|nr:glycogen synthase [Clostridiales bacterium]
MQKKILFAATEMTPFIKTGGLADVIGSLPHELSNKNDFTISVVMPFYKNILNNREQKLISSFYLNDIDYEVNVYFLRHFNLDVYFIKNNYFFERDYIYGYDDDAERFNYFCMAILEMLEKIKFKPDVIHVNDWQTSLVSAYLKEKYKLKDFYKNIKTVLTIHNLQYQGIFSKSFIYKLNLENFFSNLEFYGNINFLKSGIIYSDFITTVSEKYATEIQTSEYGFGLDGLLRRRKNDLIGILNGLNYKKYQRNFDTSNIYVKYNYKKELLEKLNLKNFKDNLLISIVSRFADQKGFDLVYNSLESILNLDINLVICGKGDKNIENIFLDARDKFNQKKNNFRVILTFDEDFANKIYISSDVLLMPSRFEPCGLAQIIAMNYGTIPIARDTGGLSDTIKDNFDGFLFKNYDNSEMINTIKKVIEIYKNKTMWGKIIFNAISNNFSWQKSIDKYIDVYQNL